MSEIDPKFIKIQQTLSQDSKIKSAKPDTLGKDEFVRVLNEQFEKSDKISDAKVTQGLPELQGSFRAQTLNLELDRTQFTQKLEASLSLLESYAAWLDDPEKSLKQAHGLLEQMLNQTKVLEQEFLSFDSSLESNDNSHPDLAQILSQLKTTLQVEQIKFDRGDYLN
ncbi:MAG: hypothetical protein L3J69_11260 [Desulfobacula sp.]|nr:hypothetical protein [Desulfobacula sp.]